ncbi:MAG: hypothetical protein OHK0046_10000 [Anaerolineae bacterium]
MWQVRTVDGDGYRDGVYTDVPGGEFHHFTVDQGTFKYARTNQQTSSTWAEWVLPIPETDHYEIEVWIPPVHANSGNARYHINGIVGAFSTVTIPVQQYSFPNQWVSLGLHHLNAPEVKINLNNYTGEIDRELAFTMIRWRKHVETPLSDGFDSPVGIENPAELLPDGLWLDVARGRPLEWHVTVQFNQRYTDGSGSPAIHTGLDFNLNPPGHWNKDAGQPVYAIAHGVVTYAKVVERYWGGIVIVRHDPMVPNGPYVYSRSAHLKDIFVEKDQRVRRGEKLGTIGANTNKFGTPIQGNEHLHFDISQTEALYRTPTDWPKLEQARVLRDYVDPKAFIAANRPRR